MSVPKLDLVFACDCTSSMGSYIEAAKQNISKIMEDIQASEKRDVRFAVVAYRDHKDDFVTDVFDFTTSVRKAKDFVSKMSPKGGGDTPEAVAEALHQISKLPYRKDATKVVVFVADAPCHGLTKHGSDSYPEGSPNGLDPIEIVRKMSQEEIIIYSVGCEPQLSNSPFARDFFQALSLMTGGKYVPLANASALPNVIIGGVDEEVNLEKMSKEIEEETKTVLEEAKEQKKEISEDQIWETVSTNLQKKGVQISTLNVEDIGTEKEKSYAEEIAKFNSLKEVREFLNQLSAPAKKRSSISTVNSLLRGRKSEESSTIPSHSAPTSQKVWNTLSPVSSEQVKRVMHRKSPYK